MLEQRRAIQAMAVAQSRKTKVPVARIAGDFQRGLAPIPSMDDPVIDRGPLSNPIENPARKTGLTEDEERAERAATFERMMRDHEAEESHGPESGRLCRSERF